MTLTMPSQPRIMPALRIPARPLGAKQSFVFHCNTAQRARLHAWTPIKPPSTLCKHTPLHLHIQAFHIQSPKNTSYSYTTMSPETKNPSQSAALAQTLKSLHTPGTPLILTNAWDPPSARAIASLSSTRALATASAAIAQAAGLDDQALTFDANLAAARNIAAVAAEFGLPLTVDFQDGYGARLEEGVGALVGMGVVGINLEDFGREVGGLYGVGEAQERVRRVLRTAEEAGVRDFVVNARTDALLVGGSIEEAIERGKAYLEAGATTAFIWGGKERGGMSVEEVKKASKELEGRLNVSLQVVRPGGLTVGELREIGVARISLGPQVMVKAMEGVKREMEAIVSG
ncbi:Phosphoenolpyruvate/pyruvate domain-containing protein [Corynespora cassiicola Philippines]|uniref:Phosphoenolpyruvate/pyruvate domain-containing protein n=1 Tax=Corynespora cassiicola Philippines TaxID=1448308 RepID=A0A2T2N9D8_CORCC|nr:Phosphoenolpyruvate/pyruvate domain-containing protein [Corynespora cassiicola Philippines]